MSRTNNSGNERRSESVAFNASMMVGAPTNIPAPFFQPETDIPSDTKVVVNPGAVRLTTASIRRAIKRNALISQYFLNAPLTDPLISVSRIYKTLDAISFNYERKHTDSFWGQYPEAQILKPSEHYWTESDALLRKNRQVLCKRFAHYAYQYSEAKKLELAALINLNTMTRLNGEGLVKDIASDVRWSYINTRCNMFSRSPTPKGVSDYMISKAAWAVGKTTYGAEICAFPLYVTDIAGNRAIHTQGVHEFLMDNNDSVEKPIPVPEPTGGVLRQIDKAHTIVEAALEAFLLDTPLDTEFTAYGNLVTKAFKPTMVPIENGGTFTVTKSDSEFGAAELSATTRLNADGNMLKESSFNNHSTFTHKLWNSFSYWDQYIIRFFPEMLDPYSDKAVLMMDVLGLVEHSKSLEDINKAVRAVENIDPNALAALMQYKKGNQPNTATIVKFAPLSWEVDESISTNPEQYDPDLLDGKFNIYGVSGTSTYHISSAFEENFERYPVDSHNPAEIIQAAKIWPHINPSILNIEGRPHVVNAAYNVGDGSNIDSDSGRSVAPVGQYATLLDYALTYSHNPDESVVEGFGVAEKPFFDFVTTNNDNEVVFTESPDTVFVVNQPLIDTTDLAQCGFCVVCNADTQNPNVWEEALFNAKFYQDGTLETAKQSVTSVDMLTPVNPVLPVFDKRSEDVFTSRAHLINPGYRMKQKYSFIFVGVAIFNHPSIAITAKQCGHYQWLIDGDEGEAIDQTVSRYIKRWDFITSGFIVSADEGADTDLLNANPAQGMGDAFSGVGYYYTVSVFSPLYPAPVIASEWRDGMVGTNNVLPIFDSDSIRISDQTGEAQALYPVNPRWDSSAGTTSINDKRNPNVTVQAVLFANLERVAWSQLVYFLARMSFMYPQVSDSGYIEDAEMPTFVEFGQTNSWVYTLMGTVKAMYAGLRDTKPFWSDIDYSLKDNYACEKGIPFSENNVIAPARALNATVKARNHLSDMRNTNKDPIPSEMDQGSKPVKTEHKRSRKGRGNNYSMKGSKSEPRVEIDSDGLKDQGSVDKTGSSIDILDPASKGDKKFIKKAERGGIPNSEMGII